MHRIKWLLVEWEEREGISPHYGLVNVRALITRNVELHTGKLVVVGLPDNTQRRAKIVISSDDRRFLEQQLLAMQEHSQHIEATYRRATVNGRNNATLLASQMTPQICRTMNESHNRYSTSPSSWSSDTDSEYNTTGPRQIVNPRMSKVLDNNHSMHKKYDTEYDQSSHNSKRHIMNQMSYRNIDNLQRQSKHDDPRSTMTYDQGTQTTSSGGQGNDQDVIKKLEMHGSIIEMVIEEMEEKMNQLQSLVDNWVEPNFDSILNGNLTEASKTPDYQRESNIKPENIQNQSTPRIDQEEEMLPQYSIFEGNPPEKHAKQSYLDNKRANREIKSKSNINDHGIESDSNEMVPIGSGKALVPKQLINQLEWNSHTIATRKLLMALFPRRTLATHSLTGKSSPAFMNKPAKNCLDPEIVNDIVMTVTSNCGVKESLVRSAITTKLADENKMFRTRQEKYGKRQTHGEGQRNQENIPPAGPAAINAKLNNTK